MEQDDTPGTLDLPIARVVDVSHLFAPAMPEPSCVAVPRVTAKQEGDVATYVVISRMQRTPDHATTWLFVRSEINIEDVRAFVLAFPNDFGDDTVLIDTGARDSREDARMRVPNRKVGPPHTNGIWLVDSFPWANRP